MQQEKDSNVKVIKNKIGEKWYLWWEREQEIIENKGNNLFYGKIQQD